MASRKDKCPKGREGRTYRVLPLLFVVACVPLVEISGSECPCPEGYTCCAVSLKCLDPDDYCPDHYPASSKTACTSDVDCPAHERCQSWRVDGTAAGPRVCRWDCSSGALCAAGETCQLAPINGQTLQQLTVSPLCVDETTVCPNTCDRCPEGAVGTTHCEGDQIRGCFVALDPICGVTCQSVVLFDCGPNNPCVGPFGDPVCSDPVDVTLCDEHQCADVCDPLAAGEAVCEDGQTLRQCLTLPFGVESCETGCATVTSTCSGTCSSDGFAHCID